MTDLTRLIEVIEPEASALGFDLVRVKMMASEAGDGGQALQIMAEDPATGQLVIDQCAARISSEVRPPVREVEEGFGLAGDHLEIPHSAHLRQRPARILRVFEVAQLHDVPLSRMALRLVRENIDLIDDAMRCDDECRAIFLRILGGEHRGGGPGAPR